MLLTKEQQHAIKKIWLRDSQGKSYIQFRRGAIPYFGGNCVMINWCGMWLGIEPDGYTHS